MEFSGQAQFDSGIFALQKTVAIAALRVAVTDFGLNRLHVAVREIPSRDDVTIRPDSPAVFIVGCKSREAIFEFGDGMTELAHLRAQRFDFRIGKNGIFHNGNGEGGANGGASGKIWAFSKREKSEGKRKYRK